MDLYDVAILGFRLNSREPPEQGLMRVLGVDKAAARAMLKTFPLVVKAAVSHDVASGWRDTLTGIGAKVDVRPHQAQPVKPAEVQRPVAVAAPSAVAVAAPGPVVAAQRPAPQPVQPAPVPASVRGPMHTVLERAPLDQALLEAKARRDSGPQRTMHEIKAPQARELQHEFVDIPLAAKPAPARAPSSEAFSFDSDLPGPPSLRPDDWGPTHTSNRAPAGPPDPFADIDKEFSAVELEFSAGEHDDPGFEAPAPAPLELDVPVRLPVAAAKLAAPVVAPANSNAFSDDLALPLDELPPIDPVAQAKAAAKKPQAAARAQAPNVPGRELPLEVRRELREDPGELAVRYAIPMILLLGSLLCMLLLGIGSGSLVALLALLITPVWLVYTAQRGRLAAELELQRELDFFSGFLGYLRGYGAWLQQRGFVQDGVYRESGTGALHGVYRHEREPAYLSIRAGGRGAEWLMISAFDRDLLLTTSSEAITLPPLEHANSQTCVGQALEHLANAHFEAQEAMTAHFELLAPPPPFAELHQELLDRQREALSGVPFWPLRRLFGPAKRRG